uniref:Olfactory receptor n=1 Tax=Xenopus tropicalis TaxID=8364 RepID=A0A6I8S949_XENTR
MVVGLSDVPEPQLLLFLLFLCIYLVTVGGNLVILIVISCDRRLHTPMYFFLANLSVIDTVFSSVTVPNLLFILATAQKSMSFRGCITQLSFFQFLVVAECYLLAVMAYDRYVAICSPLSYALIMSQSLRCRLVATCWVSWVLSSLHSTLHTSIISSLDYCGANKINEHFCDQPPLLSLSCSNPAGYNIVVLTEGSFVAVSPFIFVVISYSHILKTILNIHSSSGRYQAFSTCSSHLTSVGLFFGAIFFTYFYPSSSGSVSEERPLSVVYSILTPLLNPFIYSLRNQQVKRALKKVTHHRLSINLILHNCFSLGGLSTLT